MDKDVFVQNVKFWCEKRNVAPTVACKESGAGRDLLVNLQRGSFPSVAKVQLLAQYLGVTTSDLLGEQNESSPLPEESGLPPVWFSLSADQKQAAVHYMNYLAANGEKL